MVKITKERLIKDGYKIENCVIREIFTEKLPENKYVDWYMVVSGECSCVIRLARYYIHNPFCFYPMGEIMEAYGVTKLDELKGQYIRVIHKGVGTKVEYIGHIVADEWFVICTNS